MDTFQNEFIQLLREMYTSNPEEAKNIDVEEMIKSITPALTTLLRKSLADSEQKCCKTVEKSSLLF